MPIFQIVKKVWTLIKQNKLFDVIFDLIFDVIFDVIFDDPYLTE